MRGTVKHAFNMQDEETAIMQRLVWEPHAADLLHEVRVKQVDISEHNWAKHWTVNCASVEYIAFSPVWEPQSCFVSHACMHARYLPHSQISTLRVLPSSYWLFSILMQRLPGHTSGLRSSCYNLQIACGSDHTLALSQNGHAYAFGDNSLGQLGREGAMGVQTKDLDPQQWIIKDEEGADLQLAKVPLVAFVQ